MFLFLVTVKIKKIKKESNVWAFLTPDFVQHIRAYNARATELHVHSNSNKYRVYVATIADWSLITHTNTHICNVLIGATAFQKRHSQPVHAAIGQPSFLLVKLSITPWKPSKRDCPKVYPHLKNDQVSILLPFPPPHYVFKVWQFWRYETH